MAGNSENSGPGRNDTFTDADQLRHEESMNMAEKQYTAQTNSVLIQQQMLANQQTQAEQQTQAPAQSEQNQPGE